MRNVLLWTKLALLIILVASCTKTYDDIVISNKTCILKHNFIALSTVDGSIGNVDISYTHLEDGENKELTKTITLPAIIGGEDVCITYDSIIQLLQVGNKKVNDVISSRREIKRNYNNNGADYLVIKNNSTTAVRYCIIGNQPLEYFTAKNLDEYNLTNYTSIDYSLVIRNMPSPIYNSAPILYLLKPELLPNNISYVIKTEGSTSSINSVYASKLSLLYEKIGNINEGLPYNINQILDIYEDEYINKQHILFFDYSNLNDFELGDIDKNISNISSNIMLYGEIKPGEKVENKGQIWFINTNLGILQSDEF